MTGVQVTRSSDSLKCLRDEPVMFFAHILFDALGKPPFVQLRGGAQRSG